MKKETEVRFHSVQAYVSIKSGRNFFTYLVGSILYVKAEGNYCRFYFEDGSSRLLYNTLACFERQLAQSGCFMRVHRSYLVNLLHNSESSMAEGTVLDCGTVLPVSRSGIKKLDALFVASRSHR